MLQKLNNPKRTVHIQILIDCIKYGKAKPDPNEEFYVKAERQLVYGIY